MKTPFLRAALGRYSRRLSPIIVGLGLGVGFWILDSFADAVVFGEGTFVDQLHSAEPSEVWVRFVVFLLLFLLAIYSRHSIRELRDAAREKAKLETQLRRAQRVETIGTLAGGVAHDFNNLLTPILGYSDLLLYDANDPTTRERLRQIQAAANRAKGLVNQILTFSRESEGERRPVRCQEILDEALELLRGSIPASIDIELDVDDQCPPALGDPAQIHQIIMNLCANAVDAMHGINGLLRVSLREQAPAASLRSATGREDTAVENENQRFVLIRVEDNGCGMEPQILERAFDPFFTKRRHGVGSGLGLSVVHGIVTGCDGVIGVETTPDKGTAFNIYLPLAPLLEGATKEHATVAQPTGSGRILFVDDKPEIAFLGKEMLERLGYDVTVRTSSIEALEAFRGDPERFVAVVTDQTMPNMSGASLASELLLLRPDLPIVLITGYSDTMTRETCERVGIRGFLHKPFVASELNTELRRVIDAD